MPFPLYESDFFKLLIMVATCFKRCKLAEKSKSLFFVSLKLTSLGKKKINTMTKT